jgi:hypothetical protein
MVLLRWLMGKRLRTKDLFFEMKVALFRSCISEDNLCNWSYGTCPHANISEANEDLELCLKKKSTVDSTDCQCDRGYRMEKVKKIFTFIHFYFLICLRI